MRKIKIKLKFNSENPQERHEKLLEIAKTFVKEDFFTILEEKHFERLSYIVVLTTNKDLADKAFMN
jgi:hypothetical protein